jgi:hypothetical protein
MVLTVEPGCYFMETQIDAMLKDPALSRFVHAERLPQVWWRGEWEGEWE